MYKISWIKGENDNSFKIPRAMGLDVFELSDLDKVDEKIQELKNQNYSTIILSNLAAGYSQDIIKKYKKDNSINIIITPFKEEWNKKNRILYITND